MKDFIGVLAIVAFCTVFQTANSLQCWKCSSDIDRSCHDRFNESDILARRGGSFYNNPQQNYNQRQYDSNYNPQYDNFANNYNGGQTPILETCDDNEARLRRMKNVCIKKTVRGTGYVSIIRRCAMIPPEQDVGTCQEPVSRGLSLDFCEYCEYDGCNSAMGFKTNYIFASVVSLILVLFVSL